MIHYDVQLMGGVVLHQGKIAEMATGEGKTLVSTLPAYLNALTGEGVHIVTVNDYLARRDSQWNGPIFEFHGLRVDCIDVHPPNSEARRNAYRADVTYGTNNEFGFDYLRDNMVPHPDLLVQRDHHYAIIDEIDSVLIDEARTPLIISGPVPQGDRHEFAELRPRIEKLIQTQSADVTKYLSRVRELMKKENDKEARKELGVLLLRCHRALPKFKPLIKILSEPGMKQELLKTEAYYLQDGARNMHIIDDELYFVIDEKNNTIELTEKGRELITKSSEDPDLFVLPDIAAQLSQLDAEKSLSDEERLRRKDQLLRNYAEKSERLHSISQLLRAYALFEKDVDYIVADGKVLIVDENTGRVLPGRRYSDGLHQAIEAKENVKIEDATQTFATITLQNYFRMYHKLAGMTGTAETEAAEFYQIYKLDVVCIPTNKPVIRKDLDDLVYKTKREKYAAIIDEIQRLTEQGRPVLVGTASVETSELLSRALTMRKIPHNVLNAKHHQREAEIVANAGLKG
ncbi:MAG: preprotein translocase subunit SecA, partial [Bacteroidia bacterium]|nr:preprotein translocase subunit SecA [Bacteroidia bacterium]